MTRLILPIIAAAAVSLGAATITPANAVVPSPIDQRSVLPAVALDSGVYYGTGEAKVIKVHRRHKRYSRYRRYRHYHRPAFGFYAYPYYRHRYHYPYYYEPYHYRRPGVGFGFSFGF